MTREENLAVFWKSFAMQLRKAFPKLQFLRDVNLGTLQDEAEVLWNHADREDWWAHTPNLNWTMEQVATIAFIIGKGFKFTVGQDVLPAHNWKEGLLSAPKLEDIVVTSSMNCEVCKSPNLVEIELLLAKGMGRKKLAAVTKFSEYQLGRHIKVCMHGRLERLEGAMGAILDLETYVGAADMLGRAFGKAEKFADMAADKGELGTAALFVDKMKDVAVVSAEISGEKSDRDVGVPVAGPQQIGGPVNVVFMPTTRRKRQEIIDGTVIEEE